MNVYNNEESFHISYRLWRASKWILITSSFWSLECVPLDKICYRIFRTPAMHNLLCWVSLIRIRYVWPSHVTKILTAFQFFSRLAHLKDSYVLRKITQIIICSLKERMRRKLPTKYTVISTLYCLFLSTTVNPSLGWMDVEQVPGLPFEVAGHLHCLSTQGLPYVSTLLHTMFGLQTGNDSSVFWNNRNCKVSKMVRIQLS